MPVVHEDLPSAEPPKLPPVSIVHVHVYLVILKR